MHPSCGYNKDRMKDEKEIWSGEGTLLYGKVNISHN